MLQLVFLIATTVVLLVVGLLLILARQWPEQAEQFRRVAGWFGLAAGVATLATNLWALFDGIFQLDGPDMLFLVMAALPPLVIIGSAVATLMRRQRGHGWLLWSTLVWLAITLLGYIGTLTGFYVQPS